MENFEINIPEEELKNDLTIIYKGREENQGHITEPIEEIRTSKEILLRKLRYFKNKINELKMTNEIFIHDVYPTTIFKEFIDTLETHKIHVNENNYHDFYKLSSKYEYDELQQVIEHFSKNRPDLQRVVDSYSQDELDPSKENKISEHLDICLENANMRKYPIGKLNRILNSPTRKLSNHHLLFEFVKKIIKERSSTEDRGDLVILASSLDYMEMTNDELDEILNDESFNSIFKCRHSEERMKLMNDERKQQEARLSELEERIGELEERMNDEIEKRARILYETESKYSEYSNQQRTQSQDILKLRRENEHLRKSFEEKITSMNSAFLTKIQKQNQIISNLEQENANNLSLFEEKITNMNSMMMNKMSEQNYIISKYQEENKQLRSIIDEKIASMNSEMRNKITEQNQIISKLQQENRQHRSTIEDQTAKINEMLKKSYEMKQQISRPVSTKTKTPFTFEFTGKVQSVKLCKGNYKLEVWGAEGGITKGYSISPGLGGYSVGVLNLNEETTLYVYVGEHPTTSSGGWNGGGSASPPAAGGGGSTDISLSGEDGSRKWKSGDHLYSRIIVAGAGGGAGMDDEQGWAAGCGGGLSGQDGKCASCIKGGGQAATETTSSDVSTDQGFGVGGSNSLRPSSGGGSGWFGGCAYNHSVGWGPGAAGGSGYVYSSATASNYPRGCKLSSAYYLTESKTIAGDSEFPNSSGTGQERGHHGHGYAKITLI